jgi:hypothetical protein
VFQTSLWYSLLAPHPESPKFFTVFVVHNLSPSNHKEKPMTETSPAFEIPESPSAGASVLFILATLWIIVVTILTHFLAWFTGQLLQASGITMPGYVWFIISWVHGVLLAGPIIPLTIYTRAPRLRAAYQTWLLATLFLFTLASSPPLA